MSKKVFYLLFLLIIVGITAGFYFDNKVSDVSSARDVKGVQEAKDEANIDEAGIATSSVSILPEIILPGDPVYVTIDSTSTPIQALFDNKLVSIFTYNKKSHVIFAVDFYEKVLEHKLVLDFADGSTLEKVIKITPRKVVERPLSIPAKLGGDTKEAEAKLLANLAKENLVLNSVKSSSTILWSKAFGNPLLEMKITDDYGYDRKTVDSVIVHKGTDFHAPEGTKVFAMNDGVVKVAREFIIYGNSVIIDHGLGIQTLYMHLSKTNVKEGQFVKRGDLIGFSGQTGYAEQSHLHISIKIGGVSIDPMVFLGFFR